MLPVLSKLLTRVCTSLLVSLLCRSALRAPGRPGTHVAMGTYVGLNDALAPHQVEWLVMRAMSLKLVKGVMDEVERVVHVSWVQPRVLEKAQLLRLAERLAFWRGRVDATHVYVEEQTPELFG